jgi:DNA (cytosine-5)-methyltransferase 1
VNVIDLFGGVGGFSLGAHYAGFSVPLVIDLDHTLTQSRPTNFPKGHVLHADITDLDPIAVLRSACLKPKEICGIIGGPPCQGFSAIGARRRDDPRNQLVLEYFRFVRAVRPAFFVLENVPGILLDGNRRILEQGMETVESAYTLLGPLTVDAADFGAPTRRRRVLVIGYRSDVNGISEADLKGAETDRATTVFEAIHDLSEPSEATLQGDGEYAAGYSRSPARGLRGAYARRSREAPPADLASAAVRAGVKKARITGFKPTLHTPAVRRRFARLIQGTSDEVSRCPRLAWDAPCPTLRAGTGPDRGSYQAVRPIHPEQARVITVREAARLQGFPDWFQFHPTQWHSFRMIGNSVSPILAETILGLLRDRTGS